MPFIPVPDCVQVELVYLFDTQRCQNVLHYNPNGAYGPDEMLELGAEMVDWFDANMQPNLATTISLIAVRVTDLATATAPSVEVTSGLPLAGTLSSPALPNNVSCVITKRTVFRGRSYRGRIYMAGITEADVTNNIVAGARLTSWLDAWAIARSMVTTGLEWTMGVVSRFEGGSPRAEGILTPVLGFTSDGVVDSQRRRLPGRGQ